MNEQIRVRMRSNGLPLPIEVINAPHPADRGVVLRNEISAAPRRVRLEFRPFGGATQARVQQVQQRMNWSRATFPLTVGDASDGLIIAGVKRDTLPAGLYDCRLAIDDITLSNAGRFRADVPEGGVADIVLEATDDPRQVRLTSAADQLDPHIRRVLTAAASSLDGVPAIEWLTSPTARSSRKACLLNVLAKLSADVPTVLAATQTVFFADVDRIYVETMAECAALMRDLAAGPNEAFIGEGRPGAAVHLRMLRRAGVTEADYDLFSYRQRGRDCLQVVVAVPKAGRGDRHFAEFDIDLGNAREDVVGILIHFGELTNPARTDHFAMRDRLLRTTAAAFLTYDIVEPHVDVRIIDGV